MWAHTFSIDLNPYFENVHQINETIVNLKHEVSTAIDNRRNSIRDPNDNNPHLLQLTNNTSADSRVNVISKLRELKEMWKPRSRLRQNPLLYSFCIPYCGASDGEH